MTIPSWFTSGDMLIHQFFFNHGIVVLKTPISETDLENNEIISHNDRFSIFPIENFDKKQVKYVNKQKKFLAELIPTTLQGVSNIDFSTEIVLSNGKRRTEIFLPVMFIKEKISIYLHAWITQIIKNPKQNPKPLSLSNVERYITAGCIFGSGLKAKSENGEDLFTLIHMDMDFFSDKQINNIVFEKDNMSIYEDVLFHELDRFAKLIQVFSPTGVRRTLFYHLPYYDYILFVAALLIRKRITYEVFDRFHQLILDRSKLYISEITKIFQPYAIDVIIESPYQNIFGDLARRDQYTTDNLLNKLDINLEELTDDDLSTEDQKKKEKELIQNCWNKLLGNNLDLLHREIWGHFLLLYAKCPPNSFKELLERANAMMVARASWKQEHYTTCSMLPHSEKQIQVGYSKLLKKFKEPNKVLSAVLNLIIFDPVVTCSQEKNIGVFSCDKKVNDIEKTIQFSREKLFFFASKSLPITAPSDLNIRLSKNL